MAIIQFYQKQGCATNTRQRQMLEQAGHHLVVLDLLAQRWRPGQLRRFFGHRSVAECFNRNAPAIKCGDLVPEQLTMQQALPLMIEQPILIRRPFIHTNGRYWVGFDLNQLDGLLANVATADLESCIKKSGDSIADTSKTESEFADNADTTEGCW